MHIKAPEWLDFEAVKASERVRLQPGQSHCLVDLSQTQFMDSTGAGLLLRLRRQCRMAGGALVLLSPNASVSRLLKSLGLRDCFGRDPRLEVENQAPGGCPTLGAELPGTTPAWLLGGAPCPASASSASNTSNIVLSPQPATCL
jgi:anti-anti-sigma factor